MALEVLCSHTFGTVENIIVINYRTILDHKNGHLVEKRIK